MRLRRKLIAFVLSGLAIAGLFVGPAPAAFALSADVGPVNSGPVYSCPSPVFSRGNAFVTLNGDYVTVTDTCSDGRSVQGRVGMIVNGVQRTWNCTNSSGAGTTKTCQFDWPEGFVGFKTIFFYSAANPGESPSVLGQLRHWRDG
jgi:hypothetical protein